MPDEQLRARCNRLSAMHIVRQRGRSALPHDRDSLTNHDTGRTLRTAPDAPLGWSGITTEGE